MTARIYKPCKTAMQSGIQRTKKWVLEFIPKDTNFIDPIMGWTGGADTLANQVILGFATQAEAIEYAKKHNIDFLLSEPNQGKMKKRAYTDNFKYHPYKEEI